MTGPEPESDVGTAPGTSRSPEQSTAARRNASAVARGSALLFSSRIVGNAGYFLAVLLLARGLSVPDRGTFAFVAAAALLCGRIAGLGVPDATTVFAAGRPSDRDALLSNALLFATLSSLVVGSLVCGVLFVLGDSRPADVTDGELVLLGLGAIFTALVGAANAFLTGCTRWRTQSAITALTPWLYALLLAIVWAGPGLTVPRALLAWIALQAASAVPLIRASRQEAALRGPSLPLLGESVRFGVRAWVGSVTLLLNYRVDQLLMGFLASQAALGVYAVAVNASEILLIVPSAVGTALIPVLARSDPASRADQTLRTFRLLILITGTAMVLGASLGSVLLPVVFGTDYRAAVVPFLWLVAGTIGFVASDLFSSALVGSSLPGRGSLAPLVSLVVGVALDFALIPPLGATGAAVASACAFLAGGLTALVTYRMHARFAYRVLVPTRNDLAALRDVARDLLHTRSGRSDLAGGRADR
jgi:O-antigen/teichoic acid export membrane protein